MSLTDTTAIQELTPEALAQVNGVTATAGWLPKTVTAPTLEEPAVAAYEAEPAVQPGRVALRLVSQQQLAAVMPIPANDAALAALAEDQGQSKDLGDVADTAHILDYARGALVKLREMKAMTGDPELDELISRLAADLEQGNISGLREMLDDINQAITAAAGKGSDNDGPETPQQKTARLWAEIDELNKKVKSGLDKAHENGDISDEQYSHYNDLRGEADRLRAEAEALPEGSPEKKAAQIAAAEAERRANEEAQRLAAEAEAKARREGREQDADTYRTTGNDAGVIVTKTRDLEAALEQPIPTLQHTARETVTVPVSTASQPLPEVTAQLDAQSADSGFGAISLGTAPAAAATTSVNTLPTVQLSTPIQLTEADPASTGQLPAPTAPVQLAKAEVGGPSTSF